MESCIHTVRIWMNNNFLKLNDDKTEVIVFRSKNNDRPCLDNMSVRIGDKVIQSTPQVRNLGVYMDQYLGMNQQVNYICKSTMYHIRQVGQIRKYLDKPSTEKLIHAVISSRLDYANSLLYGCPFATYHLSRLQKIQNTAARIVCRVSKYSSITSVRKKLHWLPINMRINYKILLLVFRAIKFGTPSYIRDLLQLPTTNRPIRSHRLHQLQVPASKLKSFGDRSFYHAAPSLWNSLPVELRSLDTIEQFKRALKTYLFSCSY